MNTTLGKRIAALRREKALTQEELAEKLGVSPQAISKWENDQTCPDISLLPLLANLFDITVDELLTGNKENGVAVRMLSEVERKPIEDLVLRIVIQSADNDKVRVNLPMTLIKIVIEGGFSISQISDNEALKNIDFVKIFGLVEKGAIGNLFEIESADGDKVQIFVE
jgi:transcriptional regulator with XRE-family HTH domain